MAQNLTPNTWANALLNRLGIRPTAGAVRALVGWEAAEGGNWHNTAHFNPLNTTQPEPGAGNTGTQGNIKVYRSWDQGLQATAETLRNGHYGAILQALKRGDPNAVAGAIGSSPWGTSADLVSRTIGSTSARQRTQRMLGAADRSSSSASVSMASPNGGVGNAAGGPSQATSAAVLQWLATRQQGPMSTIALANALNARPFPKPPSSSPTPAVSLPETPHGPSKTTGGGVVSDPSGKPVAAWIEPILKYARQHGWQGTVASGYRSDAEQTRIYNSGVRPAAVPKSLGGSGSNHEGSQFPLGAVDVSNAGQLAAILRNSPYRNKLIYAGAKDPVHFSHPHNGGY